ncbi:MAG TPA: CheR family methyltransferase [Opitutaceae bacterium]|nr:CheR family methyltransferase [Opitutaceae bacterium]
MKTSYVAMETQTLTPAQFADFQTVITGALGIKMPATKQVMLQSRLHRRLRELGMATFEEYHGRFFGDPEQQAAELEHLLNLATTNKTDFFREPDHFDVLAKKVLPEWLGTPTGPEFAVWCAGCATGEEAYTLAMVLEEQRRNFEFSYRIRATDVSTRVLETARRAIYADDHIEPVPLELRRRYLLRSRDHEEHLVRIAPGLRERVRFGHLNFLSADYGMREVFDVVFFRNVMIYFDRETQCEVVGRICRQLRVGGRLFIAHSETVQGMDLPLRMLGPSEYLRLPDRREVAP